MTMSMDSWHGHPERAEHARDSRSRGRVLPVAGLSRCRGWGAALVCPFRHLPRLTGEVGVQLALCLRTPTSGASLFGRSRSGWDIAVSLLHLGLSACGSLVHGWY